MSARRPQSIVLAANGLIFGYHQTRPKRKAHLYLGPAAPHRYRGKLGGTGARSYSAGRRRRRATGENEQGRLKLDRVLRPFVYDAHQASCRSVSCGVTSDRRRDASKLAYPKA